ncbi:MAG TPA: ABC transporter permease [Longimicrobiales bacterium]
MNTWLGDLRYAARALRRTPGFTAVAVLTLALGIGANTAIFSVLDGTVLHPAPWPEPERLAVVGWNWGPGRGNTMALTPAQAQLWKETSEAFEAFAITDETQYVLTGSAEPQQLAGELVSDGYFQVLGVMPALGRAFLPEEDVPGGPAVVILSDGVWRRSFGADSGVVGRTITLDGAPHMVVGVMPPGFAPAGVDVLAPLRLVVDPRDQGHNYRAFGRLEPGISRERLQAEADAFTERFAAMDPGAIDGGQHFETATYRDYLVAGRDTAVWVLFGAVGLVLLIACVNVANLLLGRVAARRAELAVRAALGAGRGRILGHLLAESVLLGLAGGGAGLVLAAWGLDAVLALAPAGVPGLDRVGLDTRVLGFALAVSLATGIAVGLAGAVRAARPDVADVLREGGRTRAGGARRLHARGLLVAAEAAFSVVLLIGAGLFIVSYFRLSGVELGFEPEGVYTAELALPPERYTTTAATWRFERQVLDRIRGLPGVVAAGSASNLPLERGLNTGARILSPGPRRGDVIEVRAVSPDLLRTLGATVVSGRGFTESDDAGAPPVALVNEAFVRRFLADYDPLGARIAVDRPERVVVGVVRDIKDIDLDASARPTAFIPRAQLSDGMTRAMNNWFMAAFAVRTDNPAAVVAALREAIHEADSQQPILRLRPMTEVVGASIAAERFRARLLTTFAGLALVLTAIGIYGVVAYTARQRTHEIGIRVALGAKHGNVVGLVVRQGMAMVAVGLGIGLVAAFALSRVVASMLYEVSATDPGTFTAVALVLGGVGLLASWIPARRAARVDPMVALRAD